MDGKKIVFCLVSFVLAVLMVKLACAIDSGAEAFGTAMANTIWESDHNWQNDRSQDGPAAELRIYRWGWKAFG